MTRPQLDTLDDYRQRFCDATYWAPYVRRVCERHGFVPCRSIESRVPGTCPVFIVDERWVVKLYGRLFGGGASFEVERAANEIVARDPALAAPRVVAQGSLYAPGSAWHWPYLIFEYVAGISLSQTREAVSFDNKLALAHEIGQMVRRLHGLPLPAAGPLRATWDAFATQLVQSRRECAGHLRARNALPAHLIDQIEHYLPPPSALLDRAHPPCLVHADLTADHVLGRAGPDGVWHMLALIDFGDVVAGDPAYDLVALHIDLFGCDRRLLRAYLHGYDAPKPDPDFARKAMAMTLLHRFNAEILGAVMQHEEAARCATLEELAAWLWDMSASSNADHAAP